MNRITFVASVILMTTSGLAGITLANATYASSYSSHREATLSGTVERIINPRTFTLRANHQVIVVDVLSDQPPVLNEGDNITVSGTSIGDMQAIKAHAVYLNQRANT